MKEIVEFTSPHLAALMLKDADGEPEDCSHSTGETSVKKMVSVVCKRTGLVGIRKSQQALKKSKTILIPIIIGFITEICKTHLVIVFT